MGNKDAIFVARRYLEIGFLGMYVGLWGLFCLGESVAGPPFFLCYIGRA